MKIAFVSKVKEKDIKKLFPWAKKIIPVLGGFIATDAAKVSQLQKELVHLAQKELDGMMKREKEMARYRRELPARLVPIRGGRRGMIHG